MCPGIGKVHTICAQTPARRLPRHPALKSSRGLRCLPSLTSARRRSGCHNRRSRRLFSPTEDFARFRVLRELLDDAVAVALGQPRTGRPSPFASGSSSCAPTQDRRNRDISLTTPKTAGANVCPMDLSEAAVFELGKTFGRQAMYRFVLVYLLFPYTTLLALEDGSSVSRAFKRVDSAVVVVRTATLHAVRAGARQNGRDHGHRLRRANRQKGTCADGR